MATPDYTINFEDDRFAKVEADKQAAMQDLNDTYSGMVDQTDQYYQAQIDASKDWADKQSQLQQEQTDFTIEQIEQEKDQAKKDYIKEQSGAYVDWQKQSNEYGSEAEQMASAGLTNTGFTESSQVAMYNAYQNRVATARESYNQAVLNYNNSITNAKLQNNSILAEIAYQSLQQQLELSLQGFQYKNTLVLEQANKKIELDNAYYQRYQDVLNQINTENAMKEEIRQYNQNYDLQVKQFNEEIRQFNQQYNESVRQFNQEYQLKKKEFEEGIRQFNEEIARLKKKDAQEYKLEIQRLELSKKELQQQQKQFEAEQKLKKEQLAEEKRQFNAQMAAKSSSGSSGGGSSGGGSTKVVSGSPAVNNNNNQNEVTHNSTALGRGPLTEQELARMMLQGKITRKKVGNQWVYNWSGQTKKQQELINAQAALDKYSTFNF